MQDFNHIDSRKYKRTKSRCRERISFQGNHQKNPSHKSKEIEKYINLSKF